MWMIFINALALLSLLLTLSNVEAGKRKPGPSHYKDNPVWDQSLMFKGARRTEAEVEKDMPEKIKSRRLLKLARSHDVNGDGFLQYEEMSEWLLESFRISDHQEIRDTMMRMDRNRDRKVALYEYNADKHKVKTERDASKLKKKREEGDTLSTDDEDFLQAFDEDQQRFATADLNHDGSLDEAELAMIVLPSEYPTMAALEIKFSMSFGDANKDGVIARDEFVDEKAPGEQRRAAEDKFNQLDRNKDGTLSADEMRPFIAPNNNDEYEIQVNGLINGVDQNGDKQLSIEEITDSESSFLYGPFTDYSRNLFYIKDDKRLEEEDRKIGAKLKADSKNKRAGGRSSKNDKSKAEGTKMESEGADKASKRDKDKKNKKDEL